MTDRLKGKPRLGPPMGSPSNNQYDRLLYLRVMILLLDICPINEVNSFNEVQTPRYQRKAFTSTTKTKSADEIK